MIGSSIRLRLPAQDSKQWIVQASTHSAHQDDNGNAPRRIRRDAARTTARYFRDLYPVVLNRSRLLVEKTQIALRGAQQAGSSIAVSLRTKTSTNANCLGIRVR